MTRTFLAIPLTDGVRAAIASWIGEYGDPGAWRWTAPENLHVTVRFYGDVADEKVPELVEALRGALAGLAPFTLAFDGIVSAPPGRPPTMLWGMFADGEAYERLVAAVEAATGRYAEPSVAPKSAIPHVTVARLKNGARPADPAMSPPARSELPVTGCALYSSVLSLSGPRYEKIADIPFAV
jgi:2'-5' RNA ligase